MPAPYNLTIVTNSTNAVDLMVNVNEQLTDGMLGPFLLVSIFAIVLIALRRSDPTSAFAAASFFTAIAAMLMVPMGILAQWYFVVAILLLISGVLIVLHKRQL